MRTTPIATEQGRCGVESLTVESGAEESPGEGASSSKKTRVIAVISLLIIIAAGCVVSPVKALGLEYLNFLKKIL